MSLVQIIGHGIDLVDTPRIARLLERHATRFVERVYTDAERVYCEANPQRRVEHFAARFAAKEAVLKAMGTGLSGGIQWTDVEVVKLATGQPTVVLHDEAEAVAEGLGIQAWSITISHVKTHAVASAIGMGAVPTPVPAPLTAPVSAGVSDG